MEVSSVHCPGSSPKGPPPSMPVTGEKAPGGAGRQGPPRNAGYERRSGKGPGAGSVRTPLGAAGRNRTAGSAQTEGARLGSARLMMSYHAVVIVSSSHVCSLSVG